MLRILVVGLVVLVAAMFMMPRGDVAARCGRDVAARAARAAGRRARRQPRVAAATFDAFRGRFTLALLRLHELPRRLPADAEGARRRARGARASARRTPCPQSRLRERRSASATRPPRIAAYLAPLRRAFVGATAPDERLAPLLAALGVTVEKARARRRALQRHAQRHRLRASARTRSSSPSRAARTMPRRRVRLSDRERPGRRTSSRGTPCPCSRST